MVAILLTTFARLINLSCRICSRDGACWKRLTRAAWPTVCALYALLRIATKLSSCTTTSPETYGKKKGHCQISALQHSSVLLTLDRTDPARKQQIVVAGWIRHASVQAELGQNQGRMELAEAWGRSRSPPQGSQDNFNRRKDLAPSFLSQPRLPLLPWALELSHKRESLVVKGHDHPSVYKHPCNHPLLWEVSQHETR